MTVTDLLIYAANGFFYFLVLIGISTIFYPIKMSLHHPQGILLGIGFTSSYSEEPQIEEINYVFFSVHLIVFSLGIFINLGEK